MAVLFSSAGVFESRQAHGRVRDKHGFQARFRAKFRNVDRVWIDVENFSVFCAIFCAFKKFFVLFKKRKYQRKEYTYLLINNLYTTFKYSSRKFQKAQKTDGP